MSIYDYDRENLRDEAEQSPETADRQVKSNMKALRLLDQTQVRTSKEATRNHNANMSALKLLDEVAGGEKQKPPPTIMPGMDLSPKQYTDNEDVKEDDIAAVDNFRRYKSSDAIAREKKANYKALKLIDSSFGGAIANEQARVALSMKAAVIARTGDEKAADKIKPLSTSIKEYTEEESKDNTTDGESVLKYKKGEVIHREKVANYKALKLMDKRFGGAANEKTTQRSTPHTAGGTSSRVAPVKHEKAVPQKKLEEMATTTRKKKPVVADDKHNPDTVDSLKSELDAYREKTAASKALEMVSSSLSESAGFV